MGALIARTCAQKHKRYIGRVNFARAVKIAEAWVIGCRSDPPWLGGLLVNDAIVKEIGGFYEAFLRAHQRVLMLNA